METATDVAGEVVEVGLGVENFKPGDKVIASLNVGVSFHLQLHFIFLLLEWIALWVGKTDRRWLS